MGAGRSVYGRGPEDRPVHHSQHGVLPDQRSVRVVAQGRMLALRLEVLVVLLNGTVSRLPVGSSRILSMAASLSRGWRLQVLRCHLRQSAQGHDSPTWFCGPMLRPFLQMLWFVRPRCGRK